MDREPHEEVVTATWRRNARVCWRRSGFTAVLAVPDDDDVLVLEGTGALTWELLDAPMSTDQLIDELAATFEVDREVVAEQLTPFLDELRVAGVVEAA